MASTDARPVPIKNTAFRAIFPIYDADGDLVSGATGLDSEVDKDQAGFADCTNEATEIATNSGLYYLDLTSTEMNADCVAVIVKTTSVGAKTTVLVFYPEETGDINVDVTAMAAGVITATVVADNTIDAGAIAADAITAAKIADGAIDAATFAAGAITATVIADGAIDAATFAAGAIDATAIAADAIGSSELAATAVAEIADAVWDEATLGHTTAGTFGEQAKTDIDDILTDTAVIGAAGAGLSAVPWNAAWDAEVQSEVQDALDATLADSVPADGTRPSLAQAIYMINQFLTDRSVSGTTVTVKKVDGTTSLMTFTLDDGTTPTSITRAT